MAYGRGSRSGPDFQQLRDELAREAYRPVYLLAGEDAHRMAGVVTYLKKKLLGETDAAFNFHAYDGDDAEVGNVVQQALSYPMMCSHQVICVKRADKLVTDAGAEAGLIKYVKKPAAETVLILMSDKVDGRHKWVKACKSAGCFFDFSPPRGRDLVGWVMRTASSQGLNMGQELAELLTELIGDDLNVLSGEIEKLALITADSKTQLDDGKLLEVILEQRAVDPFELVRLLGPGQGAAGLRVYHRYLADGRSPYELAPLLIWRVKQVAQVASLRREGVDPGQMPGVIGASPYAVKQARETADRWGDAGVRKALRACMQCESALKSSPLGPEKVLERAILDICTK
ncbi:DNA polymerase III subunit delta [bacterium]|nr:DNA polymerase III subunit delta [bacterium]